MITSIKAKFSNRHFKNQINVAVKKVQNQLVLDGRSGNNYRVATLSKSYLTVKRITMQNLKSIGQF